MIEPSSPVQNLEVLGTTEIPKYQPVTVPLLGKGLFSYREGTSIDHHACSRRVGDFRHILIISPGFLTMFSFTDVCDVQDMRDYHSVIAK